MERRPSACPLSRGDSAATLGRDAGGRIQQQTEVLGGVTTTDVYGYDAAGRLATVTRNGTLAVTYGYDVNGNRTAVTTAGGTTSATFDAQDRILTFGTRTYTHTPHRDVAGWTDSATSTTTTLTYDVQGNLRQWQQPGTIVTYTVDGRNRRIGTAVNGVPVQGFLWQGQLRPVAELDGTGALVSRFVYGTRINVPEYLERGGTTYRLVTDHLGSVRLVIDTTTDQVVQALAYDPWGVVLTDTNPGFQPFGYAGGLYDYRTGLVRFGVRDYDATTGRWLAKDPIGFAAKQGSLYDYVAGNPIDLVDPTGLDWIDTALKALADASAGFGDTVSLGATELVRDWLELNGVVDPCSTAFAVGRAAGVAWGIAATAAGAAGAGLRIERGNWKVAGDWFFPQGTKGLHFHWGKGPGLQAHHLPYQLGNWVRNLQALVNRGEAGGDLATLAVTSWGVGAIVKGVR